MTSSALSLRRFWPAAGLSARAGDLRLVWPNDDLLVELASLASEGVHDPAQMPFEIPWTRGSPETVAERLLAFHWSRRPLVNTSDLALEFAALLDETPVGVQSARAADWPILKELKTGSWLGRRYQGRGIGTRMRTLMLYLCFEGLGANAMTSTAFEDNVASNAVSRRIGYELVGESRVVRENAAAVRLHYRLTRVRWTELRDAHAAILGAPAELSGVEDFRLRVMSRFG